MERLSVSLAIEKSSMTVQDYIQKLDNIVCLSIANYDTAKKIAAFRDMLIKISGHPELHDQVHSMEQAVESMLPIQH
jgi:hypothetical protein